MQIFLKSPTPFSYVRKHPARTKGFTLVELLISVAIIGLVTTVVLVRNGSFQGTVLLKSAAYEIALSLREAQIKSVSSTQSSGNSYPYGLTFTPSQASYKAFQFADALVYPYYDISDPNPDYASDLATLLVGSTLEIYDVCINTGSGDDCTTPTRLDVSFRRPEFKSLFYAAGYGGSQTNIQSAKVKIRSLAGNTNIFVVEISQLGQISVSKE